MSDQPSERPADSAIGSRVDRVLRQAPVAPMHDDGVRTFGLGTVVFALAFVLLAVGGPAMSIDAWWLQVALSGVVIGLLATAYCVWRRNKRATDAAQGILAPTP